MTAPTPTAAPSAARKRSKRVPPLSIEEVGIIKGRRDLRAVYPSLSVSTTHTTSGTDDGRITQCTCLGWQTHGKCWHADSLVDDFWRAHWGTDTLAALVWREGELLHWLSLGPDESDESAARLELTTIGDLIGARTAEQEAA
jgi:hypothetical protein